MRFVDSRRRNNIDVVLERASLRSGEVGEARRFDRVPEIVAVRPNESRQLERVASRGESVVVASSALRTLFCCFRN